MQHNSENDKKNSSSLMSERTVCEHSENLVGNTDNCSMFVKLTYMNIYISAIPAAWWRWPERPQLRLGWERSADVPIETVML